MGILDAIKKSVLEQFDTSLSMTDILLSLLISSLISILIIIIYRKTFAGIVYNRSLPLTILLLTLATSMIIRTINSNLSLSLGMVGALSIVRFRTAVKDPVDTAFLFWGVTAGIMSGAGLYLASVTGSVGIGIIYYLAYIFSVKSKKQYLLIISCSSAAEEAAENILDAIEKKQLKSKSYNGAMVEITYQVAYDDSTKKCIKNLKSTGKIASINIVAYNNDFGL